MYGPKEDHQGLLEMVVTCKHTTTGSHADMRVEQMQRKEMPFLGTESILRNSRKRESSETFPGDGGGHKQHGRATRDDVRTLVDHLAIP